MWGIFNIHNILGVGSQHIIVVVVVVVVVVVGSLSVGLVFELQQKSVLTGSDDCILHMM